MRLIVSFIISYYACAHTSLIDGEGGLEGCVLAFSFHIYVSSCKSHYLEDVNEGYFSSNGTRVSVLSCRVGACLII